MNNKPTYVGFEHDKYYWKPDVDYKQNPLQYRIGRGQQGVLICQPYKNELYPLWRFKTPETVLVLIWLRNIYIWDLLVVVGIGIIHQVGNGLMMVSGKCYHMIGMKKGFGFLLIYS